ncbi:hypothetical protein LCGC14_0548600 [marine sediment metagenome]|uniref:Uncharacterized protein n=1 Tax=marine sediment metagenome TaxID=412755 RepID=A0A0F9RQN8_9ZZZZ
MSQLIKELIHLAKQSMNLTEAIEKLKEMDLAETYDLHWLQRHDGQGYDPKDDEFNYCYKCAKKIYDFLIGVGEKPVARYLDIPDWTGCTEKNTEIKTDWGNWGYDSVQFCHLCSCILDVPLTDAEEEIRHFESTESIKNPEEYRRLFLNMLETIVYVEEGNFPNEFHTDDEIKEAKELYNRAMDLLPKLKGTNLASS